MVEYWEGTRSQGQGGIQAFQSASKRRNGGQETAAALLRHSNTPILQSPLFDPLSSQSRALSTPTMSSLLSMRLTTANEAQEASRTTRTAMV